MNQLQRLSDGAVFDVLGAKHPGDLPIGEGVTLRRVDGPASSPGFDVHREYVQEHFTAYPPQEKPDRVDRLAEETDGWEPLQAYQTTFCPVDDKPLETGHRVTETYAGARVDASRCAVCGRFFADDTLTEIKLWKD